MKMNRNQKEEILKKSSLAFFLTKGMSLAALDRYGIFEREMAVYRELAKHFEKIYIFSYGGTEESKYEKFLAHNMEVVVNARNIPASIYVYQMAFIHRRIVRICNYIKTNQISGAESVILAKIINPKAKLIIRTGYSLTYNLKMQRKWVGFLKASVLEFVAYRFSDWGIVTSRAIKSDIIHKYLIDPVKIEVISNYVDTSLFAPSDQPRKWHDRIVYVGRLSQEKNLHLLIKALKGTGVSLDIIGRGELESFLSDYAKKQGVQVNFRGVVPNQELPRIINQYSIYVLVSRYEGNPKGLLEAMSSGLAVIGSKTRGITEVIEDNVTGILVDINCESIRAAILDLMNDPKKRETLGSNARKAIIQNNDLVKQVKKEVIAYEKLIS